ncbi:MAG: rod shape-determining protein RodA [Candidatus Kerfeldbacteria bacterium]|nr:rod shape-determining protein RodA [Candidatus Kerfeldbacteria bacterium]
MDVLTQVRKKIIRRIDWWVIGGIFFLITVGLTIQYSIGLNQSTPDLSAFYKQLIFVMLGLVLFLLVNVFDYRVIKIHPFIFIAVSVIILIAVLLFGSTINGATGWFVIGPVSFQPVEFVKFFFILFMAIYLDPDPHRIQQPRYFFFTGGVAAFLIGLILLQPDTGSSFIIFMIWFSYVVILKTPKRYIALVVASVLAASVLAWFLLFPQYQKDRLTTFLHPSSDPLDTGYNLQQSIVAVGSGSLWGRGLGLGTQSQLHFLPEVSSDFIFAVIAEEFGFIGVLLLFTAWFIIIFRLWRTLWYTKAPYTFLIILGTISYLAVQTVMVVGMNVGLLPVTGVPLPLVSAGGSSMIMTLILLGICHAISVHQTND